MSRSLALRKEWWACRKSLSPLLFFKAFCHLPLLFYSLGFVKYYNTKSKEQLVNNILQIFFLLLFSLLISLLSETAVFIFLFITCSLAYSENLHHIRKAPWAGNPFVLFHVRFVAWILIFIPQPGNLLPDVQDTVGTDPIWWQLQHSCTKSNFTCPSASVFLSLFPSFQFISSSQGLNQILWFYGIFHHRLFLWSYLL